MVSPNKAVSGEQCFMMDSGLFWKIVTGLATKTPNLEPFLNLKGIVSSYQVSISWH